MPGKDIEITIRAQGKEGAAAEAAPPRVLTIAGSDSGGGAGIQADMKTFASLRCFGMTVLTAITAQNTHGVQAVEMLGAKIVADQLDSVLGDIGADAVKTGMLGTKEIVETTAEKISQYAVTTVVVDPVMVSTSGHVLLQEDAIEAYKTKLFPVSTVITPNVKEAKQLLGRESTTLDDMKQAAKDLHAMGPKWVLVKGGDKHCEEGSPDAGFSIDVLYGGGEDFHIFKAERVMDTRNVHGTGCTLASAIAGFLAQDTDRDVPGAVAKAKTFLTEVIRHSKGLALGSGAQGPMDHNVSHH